MLFGLLEAAVLQAGQAVLEARPGSGVRGVLQGLAQQIHGGLDLALAQADQPAQVRRPAPPLGQPGQAVGHGLHLGPGLAPQQLITPVAQVAKDEHRLFRAVLQNSHQERRRVGDPIADHLGQHAQQGGLAQAQAGQALPHPVQLVPGLQAQQRLAQVAQSKAIPGHVFLGLLQQRARLGRPAQAQARQPGPVPGRRRILEGQGGVEGGAGPDRVLIRQQVKPLLGQLLGLVHKLAAHEAARAAAPEAVETGPGRALAEILQPARSRIPRAR